MANSCRTAASTSRDGGETPFGFVAVLLQVPTELRIERLSAPFVECAAIHQELRQWPGLVPRPILEGGDQIGLVDKAVLKRQNAEKQVKFRSVYRHRSRRLRHFCRFFCSISLDSAAAIALIVGFVAIGIKSLDFLADEIAESRKLIHIICSSISITDIGVGARGHPCLWNRE